MQTLEIVSSGVLRHSHEVDGMRMRSMTGVAVMPISGETWVHPPTGSLGVSLLPGVDVFHKNESGQRVHRVGVDCVDGTVFRSDVKNVLLLSADGHLER